MNISLIAPVITTHQLKKTVDFYVQDLGFQVVFQTDWYVHLQSSSEPRAQLAFMSAGLSEVHPGYRPAFCRKGLFYNLEMDNVDEPFDRMRSRKVTFIEELRDEPWGERHFTISDPNGVVLNFTKPIEPTAEFASHYRHQAV